MQDAFSGVSITTEEFGVVTATILSTTVSGNSQGGVVAVYRTIFSGGATVTITDCTISNNFSAPGGGGIFGTHTFLSVANSTISGNSTPRSGGGISVSGGLVRFRLRTAPLAAIQLEPVGAASTVVLLLRTAPLATIQLESVGAASTVVLLLRTALLAAIQEPTGAASRKALAATQRNQWRWHLNTSSLIVRNTILNAAASGEKQSSMMAGTVTSLRIQSQQRRCRRLFDRPGRSDQHRPVAWSLAE